MAGSKMERFINIFRSDDSTKKVKVSYVPKKPEEPKWLKSSGFIYVLWLENVDDSYDYITIWDPITWDKTNDLKKKVCIKGSEGRCRKGLRSALNAHRMIKIAYTTYDKTNLRAYFVFSDVIIRVSPDAWFYNQQQNGVPASLLTRSLEMEHNKSFKDELFDGRKPKYIVVPDAEVNNGEVVFQFGSGVFVPGPGDKLIGEVEYQFGEVKSENWDQFPEWSVIDRNDGAQVPIAVYDNQEVFLVGCQVEDACFNIGTEGANNQEWFSHNQGSVALMNLDRKKPTPLGDNEYIVPENQEPTEVDGWKIFSFGIRNTEGVQPAARS
jgi:hypothetical protein